MTRGLAPVLVGVILLAGGTAVLAHGILRGSSPPAGVTVQVPPRQVVITFNESVDPEFSTVTVLTAGGRRVSGRTLVAPDGRSIAAPVQADAPGTYTVRWRVLSAVDGHATSGFYAFAVATAAQPGAAPLPLPLPEALSAGPPPLLVAARWVNYLAALLVVGVVFFQSFVLRPAARRSREAAMVAADGEHRLRSIAVPAGLMLLAGSGAEVLLQTSILLDVPVSSTLGSGLFWTVLGGTRMGWSVLVRVGMIAVLLIPASAPGRILRLALLVWLVITGGVAALLGGPVALAGSIHLAVFVLVAATYGLITIMAAMIVPRLGDARIPEFPWVGVLAAAVLLGSFTLTSHAAGVGAIAVILDWAHLTAAAVWIGGLFPLLAVLRGVATDERPAVGKVLVPRFSNLAAVGVAIMVSTGLYSALMHVGSLDQLVTTAYGRELTWKLAVVAGVIALGAFNRFVLRPRIEGRRTGDGALRRFQRSTGIEAALGAVILLVVALLTITPPAKVAAPETAEGVEYAGFAGQARVRLLIAPADVGWNRIEVALEDATGGAMRDAEVTVHLSRLDTSAPDRRVDLAIGPRGRLVAEGDQLNAAGWYEATVRVRRGAAEEATAFPVRIAPHVGGTEPEAVVLLGRVLEEMRRVQTWREEEQLTDGSGGVTVTRFEMVRPDRLRYRTASGTEAVIIGATRFARQGGGAWEQDTLPSPIALEGPYVPFLAGAQAVQFGRRGTCGGEPCRVLTWESQRSSAAFAAWIGLKTHQIHSLYMVAPSHYMTTRPTDLNAPLRITAPTD